MMGMKVFIAIFLFFGIGSLIAFVITTYYNVDYLSTAQETQAKVIDLDRGRDSKGHVIYYPVFEYTSPNGELNTFYSEDSSNSYQIGEQSTLLIGKDGSIRETGFIFWIAPFITGILGLVFTGVGGGFLYTGYRQKKKKAYLLQFGRKMNAKVVGLEYNRSISVNGKNPGIVICEADLSGKKETFRSHNLWKEFPVKEGDSVDIYIDPRDSKKYWVNVE